VGSPIKVINQRFINIYKIQLMNLIHILVARFFLVIKL